MHKSLGPLLEEWNRAVSDDFDYTPNPTFPVALAIGGADADLAINDLLVDFKTREEITNPWLRDTLFQLLGYTLLDLDDSLGIRRVAILLPRQPYIAIWKLDDLLGRDADEVLPKLREAFAGVLATVLASQLGVHETEDKEPGYEADKLTTQSVTLSPSETSSGTLRNGFDAGTPTELD